MHQVLLTRDGSITSGFGSLQQLTARIWEVTLEESTIFHLFLIFFSSAATTGHCSDGLLAGMDFLSDPKQTPHHALLQHELHLFDLLYFFFSLFSQGPPNFTDEGAIYRLHLCRTRQALSASLRPGDAAAHLQVSGRLEIWLMPDHRAPHTAQLQSWLRSRGCHLSAPDQQQQTSSRGPPTSCPAANRPFCSARAVGGQGTPGWARGRLAGLLEHVGATVVLQDMGCPPQGSAGQQAQGIR